MSPADAAKLLELPADASPEQLEARFLELRRKLEDKIAKAPTPGLQAKYRESLAAITTAFEVLTLAADSSTLPILQKQGAVAGVSKLEGAPVPARTGAVAFPSVSAPAPVAAKRKQGGREFLVVAAIAVVTLVAGGWWVMHVRAEKAAAKAEAERVAAVAKAEADRAAAAAKAEEERVRALLTRVRTSLAEARIEWEAIENILRESERAESEIKSELRGLRDAPRPKLAELSARADRQTIFTKWLREYLAANPVKLARAQTEELAAAGTADEAEKAMYKMQEALVATKDKVASEHRRIVEAVGTVRIETTPAGLEFEIIDTYDRRSQHTTPATITDVPLTHLPSPFKSGPEIIPLGEHTRHNVNVLFSRTGWQSSTTSFEIRSDETVTVTHDYPEGALVVTSEPAGIPFEAINRFGWKFSGVTPATLSAVPPGPVTVTALRPGFGKVSSTAEVVAGKSVALALDQRGQTVDIRVAQAKAKIFVDSNFVGYEKVTLDSLAPGEHKLQLEAAGYPPFRTKFAVKQEASRQQRAFDFKQLAEERHSCSACQGTGRIQQHGSCGDCGGAGRIDCPGCVNGVAGYADGDYAGGVSGQKMIRCTACNGKGYLVCERCDSGTAYWSGLCSACGADGRVSDLQLAQ